MKKIITMLASIILLTLLTAGCDTSSQDTTAEKISSEPSLAGNKSTANDDSSSEAINKITIPNADDVRGNISLAKRVDHDGNTYEVTWTSSDENVVTSTEGEDKIPAGVVTRGEVDKEAVLTASIIIDGAEITKDFPLLIKAKPKVRELEAYLYCYFQDNISGKGQTQQIFLATSMDGLRWKSLNEDKPVLTSTLGTKAVRDPFLLRSKEGDKFYLLATDLDANGGDWGYYSTNGSRSIVIWESNDLVHWSEQRLVDISPKNAECMWAPEAYYDETTGEYIVYWSASVKGGNGKKIYYAKTRDFYTFSQPKIYKDVERNAKNLKNDNGKIEANLTYIDTTMLEYQGNYYRFTKREINSTIVMEASNKILGPFSTVQESVAGEKGVEGPSIFQLIGQEKWILMVDGYGGKGYFPLIADSMEKLEEGRFVRVPKLQYQMPKGARHGSFLPITLEEYEALTSKWGN